MICGEASRGHGPEPSLPPFPPPDGDAWLSHALELWPLKQGALRGRLLPVGSLAPVALVGLPPEDLTPASVSGRFPLGVSSRGAVVPRGGSSAAGGHRAGGEEQDRPRLTRSHLAQVVREETPGTHVDLNMCLHLLCPHVKLNPRQLSGCRPPLRLQVPFLFSAFPLPGADSEVPLGKAKWGRGARGPRWGGLRGSRRPPPPPGDRLGPGD